MSTTPTPIPAVHGTADTNYTNFRIEADERIIEFVLSAVAPITDLGINPNRPFIPVKARLCLLADGYKTLEVFGYPAKADGNPDTRHRLGLLTNLDFYEALLPQLLAAAKA